MGTSSFQVLGISGSLQARSSNLRLLEEISRVASPRLDVLFGDHLRGLPLFNPDLLEAAPPPPVAEWRQALASSDGVVIACPEYGHSLPGALKNGIDWVIGTGELYRKPVAVTAAVGSPERGRRGLAALKQTLLAVDARIVWDEPLVRGNGEAGAIESLVEKLYHQLSRP